MKDIVRDSMLGQAINSLSGGRILSYADQRPDYQVPTRYLPSSASLPKVSDGAEVTHEKVSEPVSSTKTSRSTTLACSAPLPLSDISEPREDLLADGVPDRGEDVEQGKDFYLVDWDGPSDPDNPRYTLALVSFPRNCLLRVPSTSVYIGSAIFTSSFSGVMSRFGASETEAALGLTLYILAYGTGPMFLTPLQELPSLGRNPVYVYGLAIFLVLNVPIVEAKNISTLWAFRFLTGFIGSPTMATGGASIGDILDGPKLPYVIAVWGLVTAGGPILGPVVGGFAAQAKDWRWPIYELMWISAVALVFISLFLPETMSANILLKRARRLRKLTGNPHLRSQSEIDQAAMSKKEIAYESLVRPFVLAAEPAVLFLNIYLGLVYAVFYLWFEAFPLVFNGIYHMNLGVGSLPFLGFVVGCGATYIFYALYLRYHLEPRAQRNPTMAVEARLEIGLMASTCVPISLFMFGWTSRESIHWIVPVTAGALYVPGIFLTFQSVLVYLSITYSKYTGSVLASNTFFRCVYLSDVRLLPRDGLTFLKIRIGKRFPPIRDPVLSQSRTGAGLFVVGWHLDAADDHLLYPNSLRAYPESPLAVGELVTKLEHRGLECSLANYYFPIQHG
ncbi:hypothetical protein V5O48_005337 [Marasmius crinis-equi]|uniref:Major facilitator superfamily (MFS) profile domain-containing protein n=1 Tax=Marasmius crinis-equi TaxID=585013 RepID=A0ABR3FMY2_9AGAR